MNAPHSSYVAEHDCKCRHMDIGLLFAKRPVIKKQEQTIIRNVSLVYLPGFVYDK